MSPAILCDCEACRGKTVTYHRWRAHAVGCGPCLSIVEADAHPQGLCDEGKRLFVLAAFAERRRGEIA